MNYKQWNLLLKKEGNYVAVDYTDPEGKLYREPFCFSTLDEALNYGKLRIDQFIQSKELHPKAS